MNNSVFFHFWCNFVARVHVPGSNAVVLPRGEGGGGVQSLFAAGVEHPYLGCTLVRASLLVAMCKLRYTSGKVATASRVTSCAYFQSKKPVER